MPRCEDFDQLKEAKFQEIKDNYPPEYEIIIRKTARGVFEQRGSWDNEVPNTKGGMGAYLPSYPVIQKTHDEELIFRQTVSDLDLTAVVKAVNGI